MFFLSTMAKKRKKLYTFANMNTDQKNTAKKSKTMTYDQAFALNGKIPPQAIEVEEAVLGALMLDEKAITNTIEILHADFFYKPEHQYIFKAIFSLVEKASPVDIITVVEQLRLDGNLENAGGAYYVSQLTNRVVTAAHVEYHARLLSEKFIQREMIRLSTETITEAYDETTDVVSLLDKTEAKLMDINDRNFRSDYQNISDVYKTTFDQFELAEKNRDSNGGITGIASGFSGLDRYTSGFQPGTLIILAGRPAMGKTAFALNIARNIAMDNGQPIAFFSLEMPATELVMRLISSEAEVSGTELKRGNLPQGMLEMVRQNTVKLEQAPIYIDDSSQLSIFELRAKCRRLKQRFGIKMVFIDYLQLMQGSSDNRNTNREQEVSYISRQLKSLSKELEVPIMALSQLSRNTETRSTNGVSSKKPELSDLRESGAIEQDADIVMFVYRPEYYHIESDEHGSTFGKADILLKKHRSGGTGEIRLDFKKEFVKFTNPLVISSGENSSVLAANEGFDNPPDAQGEYVLDSRMNNDNSMPMSPDGDAPF